MAKFERDRNSRKSTKISYNLERNGILLRKIKNRKIKEAVKDDRRVNVRKLFFLLRSEKVRKLKHHDNVLPI